MAKIGNADSARQRLLDFVDRVEEFTGTLPTRVVLFAEDFDAIDGRWFEGKPYQVERGPSIDEYIRPIGEGNC